MNNWGYLNLGEICLEFLGGTLEQQNYLKNFYLALQNMPCCENKISVKIISEESDSHNSDTFVPVIEGKYYIGEHDDSLEQYSPNSWLILTSKDENIKVITYKNWDATKDILNQALRDAIYYVCSLNNMHIAHAACVNCPWGTALLFGAAGVGKSTLAIALGASGYDVISDDKSIVTNNGIITSLGFPITFRAGTSRLIPELKLYEMGIPPEVFTNDELRFKYKITIDYDSFVGKSRIYTNKSKYHAVFLQRTDNKDAKWIRIDDSEYDEILSEYNYEIDSETPRKLLLNAKSVNKFLLPHSMTDEYQKILKVFTIGPFQQEE